MSAKRKDGRPSAQPEPNPSGLCWCGCGGETPIAKKSRTDKGWVKGRPTRYIPNHHLLKSLRNFEIDPNTGCWNWLRATSKGYGILNVDGVRTLAHRHYYELAKGKIPDGLVVDHLCNNPRCVNPYHLEAKTNAENIRRGRRVKMDWDKVRDLRERVSRESSSTGATRWAVTRDVAPTFGIHPSTAILIVQGRRWNDE